MSVGTLEIVQPGLQTTVQDYPGRIGFWRVGIPPSGPMDALAFRLANRLVGNDGRTAGLEMQFVGPTMHFRDAAVVALAGGEWRPTMNGEPVPQWEAIAVRAGDVLRCPAARTGARLYLAIAGGIEKDVLLGSRATFPRGDVGGAALAGGEILRFGDPGRSVPGRRLDPDAWPDYPADIEVEVTHGPHFDWLDAAGQELFLRSVWKVSGRSDRSGIRLEGPAISFSQRALIKPAEHGPDPTNVINTGYPIGGINFCGDTPIILPVDAPSMGGFINPFVVIWAALWKVGQARPGNRLHFRLVSMEEAIAQRRLLESRIALDG
jgi:biotin-dependent carboxylase-like uncharacterized protein